MFSGGDGGAGRGGATEKEPSCSLESGKPRRGRGRASCPRDGGGKHPHTTHRLGRQETAAGGETGEGEAERCRPAPEGGRCELTADGKTRGEGFSGSLAHGVSAGGVTAVRADKGRPGRLGRHRGKVCTGLDLRVWGVQSHPSPLPWRALPPAPAALAQRGDRNKPGGLIHTRRKQGRSQRNAPSSPGPLNSNQGRFIKGLPWNFCLSFNPSHRSQNGLVEGPIAAWPSTHHRAVSFPPSSPLVRPTARAWEKKPLSAKQNELLHALPNPSPVWVDCYYQNFWGERGEEITSSPVLCLGPLIFPAGP